MSIETSTEMTIVTSQIARRSARRFMRLCGLVAVLAAGCDAHTGADYRGEPLATLSGEVHLERDSPPPSDQIEVFYQNYTDYISAKEEQGPGDLIQFVIADSVPVVGDYPASFTLDLFEPPRVEALTDFSIDGDPDERRVGLAIIASSYDCDDFSPRDGGRCIFGGASRMALVWAEDEILPDSVTATFVGTTLAAGYHLLEYRPNFATSEEYQSCRNADPEDPADCPRWTLVGEVPLETRLSVRLIEGHDAVFGNLGGASLPLGGLELPDWFDELHVSAE